MPKQKRAFPIFSPEHPNTRRGVQMTTTFSVKKQNVNTYGPIVGTFEPTTQKTTIPADIVHSSDVTQSGSETQTSRAPLYRPERHHNKRTTPQPTKLPSVYTHKFPIHHFQFTWPYDDEEATKSSNQKEGASETYIENTKYPYEQGSASKTNSTSVPLYSDYSNADAQGEIQTQSSNEDRLLDDEQPTEGTSERKSPFYDFFHSEAPGETTPTPKREQQEEIPQHEEESIEVEEEKPTKKPASKDDDDKFVDIPNPFADPNFDFGGFLQELKASQAQHAQQLQQGEQQGQNANQAVQKNVYRPFTHYAVIPVKETATTTQRPSYNDYQSTYYPIEAAKHVENSPGVSPSIRNVLKDFKSPHADQPYQSHTALKPVQTKPGSSYSSPSFKSSERGPQTFKNSHLLGYNVGPQKTAGNPNQKSSTPKVQVKHVPVVATDDYYYYYYDDEPQQTQQEAKAQTTDNKVEAASANKKPADDEYYYYEYYEDPEDNKNKTTKDNAVVRHDYVVPSNIPINNKPPPPRNYLSPNSLSSKSHSTYKYPNDHLNLFTIKPYHLPLTTTTTPFPIYVPNHRTLYTTARPVTTVKPTVSYNRQRLTTTTNGDSRRNQPNFYR